MSRRATLPPLWLATPPEERTPPPRFLGREDELSRIELMIGRARNGRGGALLLTGEPGIGKTTILTQATDGLRELRVLQVHGYEAEHALPFSAIQRLVRPLVAHLDALPEPHRRALEVASGDSSGHPPDRFLVGLGVLGLLAAAGESVPVLLRS